MAIIYKILTAQAWQEAQQNGVYHGSELDLRDGFIHFSAADQVADTLHRHYAQVPDLLLLFVRAEGLAPQAALRWERSRGGALFPHLYAPLQLAAVQRVESLALDPSGVHVLPTLEP